MSRLIEEIRNEAPGYRDYEVSTIFIGGGTPSLMTGEQLERLMDALVQYFTVVDDAEITIECNPGTADAKKLKAFKKAGINRLSIGIQSFNDAELRHLGRIHTAKDAKRLFMDAREQGFNNINIDLMSALPGQNQSSYIQSLKTALSLQPEHISAYSLIIEEGTPFFDLYNEDEETVDGKRLPDETEERDMYHVTKQLLKEQGYNRYEISNYAKEGYACKHNLVYWQRGDYLGLGLGASSMIQNRRFKRTDYLETYMTEWKYEDVQILNQKQQMEETMFLGLRCTEGISLSGFEAQFGGKPEDFYQETLIKYKNMGMLIDDGKHLYLSDQGLDVSNYIMAEFIDI